jgi:hypothetical protein
LDNLKLYYNIKKHINTEKELNMSLLVID